MAKKKAAKKRKASKKTKKKPKRKAKPKPKGGRKHVPKGGKQRARDQHGLTEKERLFVQRYIVHLNGTRAATEAGYAKNSARVTASQLLAKPNVMEAVADEREAMTVRNHVDQDRVIQELGKLAFADFGDYATWADCDITLRPSHAGLEVTGEDADAFVSALPPGATAAVKSVERKVSPMGGVTVSITLHDKKGALDSLAKILGLFKERKELSGTLTIEDKPGIDWSSLSKEEARLVRKAIAKQAAEEA